jgi:hypothetical protein
LEKVGVFNHIFQPPSTNRFYQPPWAFWLLNPEFWIPAQYVKEREPNGSAFIQNAPAILASKRGKP